MFIKCTEKMVVYYDCFFSALYNYFSLKQKEALDKFIWEDKCSKIIFYNWTSGTEVLLLK